MYLKDYCLLKDNWKAHFDFFSLKKIDHNDLSEYKLAYNKALFNILVRDQNACLDRGMTKYEEEASALFERIDREKFLRNKDGISLNSLIGAISEGDVVTGIHLKELDGFRYPSLIVKCHLSLFSLNDEEVEFLSTALPCHIDTESATMTISIANIPILKNITEKKEILVAKWAFRICNENVSNYYNKVFSLKAKRKSPYKFLYDKLENLYINYFL